MRSKEVNGNFRTMPRDTNEDTDWFMFLSNMDVEKNNYKENRKNGCGSH